MTLTFEEQNVMSSSLSSGEHLHKNLKMCPEGVAEMMCSHKRSARKDRWMDGRHENITPPATAIAGADALTLHCVRLTGKPWMIFCY